MMNDQSTPIPLYQKLGFEVFKEGQLPGYSLRTWGMRRSD
jgi:hypothetical protein